MLSRLIILLIPLAVLHAQLSFTTHQISDTDGARDVASVDMDKDGDLDLLATFTSTVTDNAVRWYENNGSLSFTANTISAAHEIVYTAEAIDLDEDGDMDVLIGTGSDTYDHVATWARNNGSQSFTIITIASSFNNYRKSLVVFV